MITSIAAIIFFAFAALFFVSLFTLKSLWRIILFVIFMGLCYISIPELLGQPKPIYNIPLYSHANWDDDSVTVVGGYWNKDEIILMLDEPNGIRVYEWPMDQEFLDKIKKAQELQVAQNGTNFGFKLKKSKGNGAQSSALGESYPDVDMPEPPENHSVEKQVPPPIDQGHSYFIQ